MGPEMIGQVLWVPEQRQAGDRGPEMTPQVLRIPEKCQVGGSESTENKTGLAGP